MDQKAILDHQFLVAAYAITWAIQLGYLAWLGLRWRAQKRESAPSGRNALTASSGSGWPQVPRQ
jgi:hypothetical protein